MTVAAAISLACRRRLSWRSCFRALRSRFRPLRSRPSARPLRFCCSPLRSWCRFQPPRSRCCNGRRCRFAGGSSFSLFTASTDEASPSEADSLITDLSSPESAPSALRDASGESAVTDSEAECSDAASDATYGLFRFVPMWLTMVSCGGCWTCLAGRLAPGLSARSSTKM